VKIDKKIYFLEGLPVPETPAEGGHPPFWRETALVGKPLPRVDAYERVSGAAVYPSDILLPNMLYGAVLRCPHPHAKVRSINTVAAEKMAGVRGILTADSEEVKGIRWKYRDREVPLLNRHCLFEGEPVAAVVADSWYRAADAVRAIEIDWEILPFVVDHEKARDESAPEVGQSGNVISEETSRRGDVEKGFAEADVVLEETYRTSAELHTPMELHGCVASWDCHRLTIWESTQGVYAVQAKVARALSLPLSGVRVIGHYVGGGFGSKLSPGKYTVICALLARKAGRPVKLLLSREETYLCVGNRSASTMRLKAGVRKDGTLTALQLTCSGSSGAYPAGGVDFMDWLVRDLYLCGNVETTATDLLIHAGPARPFRAPGHPQGAWALEQMMDALADRIGMDPVELRLHNIPLRSQAREGSPAYTVTGLRQCLEQGALQFAWQDSLEKARSFNRQNRHLKRGLGVASGLWIAGDGGPPSTVILKLYKDGSANLNMGASDIGTGTKTVMVQVAAEELGLHPAAIQIEHADTATTRFATPSGGSKTVPTEAPAVRNAAIALKQELLRMAAEELGVDRDELEYRGDTIVSRKDAGTRLKITEVKKLQLRGEVIGVGYRGVNIAGKAICPFGAQFCELEVNMLSGEIRLLRFLGVHDSGRVMNRLGFDSQVYGGIVMGIGFGLTEYRQFDENQTGKLCNRNWHDYKLPTALDVPQITLSVPIELDDQECNNTGAKGLGEPVTIPTAAAIANALHMATGVRFTRAPVLPIDVVAGLSQPLTG